MFAWTVGYTVKDPQADTLTQAHKQRHTQTYAQTYTQRHVHRDTPGTHMNTHLFTTLPAYMSLQVNTMIPGARFHGLSLSARDSRTQ